MGFQRARSAEQREQRREAILAAAAAMLGEMPVSAVSLNELSRRVGLAKSNVLRYFESREEILMELLVRSSVAWLGALAADVAATVDFDAPIEARTDRFAALFAEGAAARPELLDLLAAQSAVLERNVSTEAVVRCKRALRDALGEVVDVLLRVVPELGAAAPSVCLTALTLAGAFYLQAEQAAACTAAYEEDPSLEVLRVELVPALESAVATLIAGAVARAHG
ncbi:TetR family transcriptional regulator [Tsukamurella sp. 8F]|uniref:TetR family transcriptional regulator n=1 Tax=unclassified Tsukamurella TaxID=2633480 RepID=UPI0023B9F92B|nr:MULTISPECIES: TetR family transcriptional regulator [unclassified Tsukamurella]MDF0529814.1 TetR family transcriptional regulator [Tsukamurella sp. 8J]MDF0587006.1 TetR family transcriptional regulator [Tsukamurella sp. 8F]